MRLLGEKLRILNYMMDSQSHNDQENNYEQRRYSMTVSLTEMQAQQKVFEDELEELKIKIEANNLTNQEQLRNLERAILEVRDKARDAMHITIGVDGKNGLRGSLETLVRDVTSMSESFSVLKSSANSYSEMKTLLLRLFAASAMTIMCQFGGAVWLVSSLHSKQESMREDLNRVLAILDKRHDDASKAISK